MKYPKIIGEVETLELAIAGSNIARFGDGEIRLARGGRAASQEPHPVLKNELKRMLSTPGNKALICLPNLNSPTPEMWFWKKYIDPKIVQMYGKQRYGSTWITRPDCAPWIDESGYWNRMKDLWRDRDVVLVVGDHKSLTVGNLLKDGARSVRPVWGPRQHAYKEIDRIEAEIGKPSGSVLMCLGATATVLAERLARKGVHAVDLGHVGMFMRRKGLWSC